jgi:hypothetical protein
MIKIKKDPHQAVAARRTRPPPSAEQQERIEQHLKRVRELGALIDEQWEPKSVSAEEAIAEQRR